MHHPTDRITHTMAFVTPVVEHWLEREICTRGDRSKENQFPVPNPKLPDKSSTCVLGHQHDGNDGRGGTVNNMIGKMEDKYNNMMGKMEDKHNNMRTRGTRSLLDLPPRVYIHDCYRASSGLSYHDYMSQTPFRAHMGNLRRQLNTC